MLCAYKIKFMEDSNKLFVFEKKEVLLIFVFVVLIAVTAFTLGVRVGKGLVAKDELTPQKPVKAMELKSEAEEDADRLSELNNDKMNNSEVLGTDSEDSSLRLNDLDEKFKEVADGEETSLEDTQMDDVTMPSMDTNASEPKEEKRDLSGKYTIQLVSRKSPDAAAEFAEPFRAAGYDVIVNEVEIEGKGTWYRVSIGAFNTKIEAEEYMQSENDLFQGKDYIIKQFR